MNYRDYDREVHGDEAATEVAKLEAKNEALQNRVAELERCMKEVGLLAFMRDAAPGDITAHMNRVMGSYTQRLREVASQLRSLSPGPHTGPMDAEDYVPLIARLIESLQSQLAWTPVSAGLPTEPGHYLFEHPDPGLTLYELVESELYPWRNIAGARRRRDEMARMYERYRRIELPKGGES